MTSFRLSFVDIMTWLLSLSLSAWKKALVKLLIFHTISATIYYLVTFICTQTQYAYFVVWFPAFQRLFTHNRRFKWFEMFLPFCLQSCEMVRHKLKPEKKRECETYWVFKKYKVCAQNNIQFRSISHNRHFPVSILWLSRHDLQSSQHHNFFFLFCIDSNQKKR